VIASSIQVTFKYLGGRIILTAILGTIYAIGFSVFGLPNAFPLAVLAGALSIIPYLGNIIGAFIAIAFGIATGEGFTALFGVIGTMAVAQVLENNVLQPWIIGSQVNMNPLFTFTSIIAFGLIWGVSGTIVAVPLVSILKQVFHHIPSLHPIAYLMDFED
jgi:predicted PurR-regulated permease PerM